MNIGEIKSGMADVEFEGEVISVSEPRQVQTKYGPNSVATAEVKDKTGTVKVSLWGNQIGAIKKGDKVKLTGCFAKEWNGDLQISVTRNGAIEVL